MSHAAVQARHLTLSRMERAAGEAFGYAPESATVTRTGFLNGATLAMAAFATALAATITYLL